MEKIVCIGHQPCIGFTFCKIKFESGNLSISGVEGPKSNGDCRGSCGQIIMHEWNFDSLSDGWSPELVEKFREIWEEWNLNDLTAVSPAQAAWIKANKLDYAYPKSHYQVYADALTEAGINPDPDFLHEGKPYKYGHAWLRREVPNDVIAFIESLPESKTIPAWV